MADDQELLKRIADLEKIVEAQKASEAALRESETFYRTISDKAFASIYVVQDGIFHSMNANAASFTGYTIEEMTGMKAGSLVHPDDLEDMVGNSRSMLHGNTDRPYVYRIVTKQGEIRWIMETVSLIQYGGRPAILGNAMDITAHRRAIARLRESENLYRAIFETTGTATIIIEEDTTTSLVNSEFVKLSGYAREDWEGKKSWTDFVVPEDRERMKAYHYLRRIERSAPPRNYEFGFVDAKGHIHDMILTVDMIPGTKKSVASFADITEHKLATSRLRESENLYRTIFETTGAATIIIEEDTTVSLVNWELVKLSGYSKEEWEGKKSWIDVVVPEDRKWMKEYHDLRRIDCSAPPRNYEFGFVNAEGDIRDVVLTIDMIPGTRKSVASFADITGYKLATNRLMESENLYRAIFETTGTATIIIEEDTTASLVNSEFVRLSGYAKEDWEGKKSWTEFVVPEDRERMKEYHCLRRIDRSAAPRNYEFGFVDAQGKIHDMILTVDMIPGTKKSVASFADITEHKRAANRLKESENLYRTIFENTGTATIIVEEDMTISLANTEFETLSGAPKAYWEDKHKWTELFSEKDLRNMRRYHRQRRIDPSSIPRSYQSDLTDIQGNRKVVFVAVAMIPGSKKSVMTLTDITEQKQIEAALRKQEQEVQQKSRNLEEVNTALKVLLKQRDEDKGELEENVLANVKDLVLPYIDKLKSGRLTAQDAAFVKILETNLRNIVSPFSHRIASKYVGLTPKEIQVANLVKDGKTTKEIADIMNVCLGAVSLHRDHLRKKLGLNNKKINLKSYLDSLS